MDKHNNKGKKKKLLGNFDKEIYFSRKRNKRFKRFWLKQCRKMSALNSVQSIVQGKVVSKDKGYDLGMVYEGEISKSREIKSFY